MKTLVAHRSVEPSETFAKANAVGKLAGITRLANVTGLDRVGVPVVMAVRPNSRSLSVFQGKGLTLELAKISALMEALETFHAESLRLPLRLSTRSDLRSCGEAVVDPCQLVLYLSLIHI